MEEETGLLYREVAVPEPADHDAGQMVLELPEGVDASEGVIMQIDGDKIHIIAQGAQLSSNTLGIAMESIMRGQVANQLQPPDGQLQPADDQLQSVDSRVDSQLKSVQSADSRLPGDGHLPGDGRLPGDGHLPGDAQTQGDLEIQDEQMEDGAVAGEPAACFVCASPCRRPVRLLLTRCPATDCWMAERLLTLLPLKLRVSAGDVVCRSCRQLVDQADQLHSQLKAVELQVRQLFRLEEKLEAEEQTQQLEMETLRLREQELARRREREALARRRESEELAQRRERELSRRREQEELARRREREELARRRERDELARRREREERRAVSLRSTSARPSEARQPEATPACQPSTGDTAHSTIPCRIPTAVPPSCPADRSGDGARRAEGTEAEAAPSPSPTDGADSAVESEHRRPDGSGRRGTSRLRRARRPWSPSDADTPRETSLPQDEADGHHASQPSAAAVPPAPPALSSPPPASADDELPDGVPTTTIEFVSFNGPPYSRLSFSGPYSRQQSRRTPPRFYCRRCSTQFANSSEMVTHVQTSHTLPWCRRCRTELPDRAELRRHRRVCRGVCRVCGLKPADMDHHMRVKHPDWRWPAGAVRGGRAISTVAEAVAPPPSHPPPPKVIEFSSVSTLREQVKNVKTSRCSLKFRRLSSADLNKIQHLNVDKKLLSKARLRPRPHTCLRCGEELPTLKMQIEHLHTVHKGKGWCRRCKTEFPDKTALALHRADCKKLTDQGECGRCGKHVKHLKTHIKRHDTPGRRQHDSVVGPDGKLVSASLVGGECSVCKKYISHRLKRHVASHVQHPCPICKKIFSREDVIVGHIKRVHMKERPHICNHCGKGFVSLYSMQRHEMIHTNSYKFYCQECGEGFRQKQQLTAHMRHKHGVVEIEFEDVTESTMLGELVPAAVSADLRFLCQECGAGFQTRSQLTGHMRRKHGVANVVFEDVHLHVADAIGGLDGAAAAASVDEPQLAVEEVEIAAPADHQQQWWGGSQSEAY